jgi:hypothetical protein
VIYCEKFWMIVSAAFALAAVPGDHLCLQLLTVPPNAHLPQGGIFLVAFEPRPTVFILAGCAPLYSDHARALSAQTAQARLQASYPYSRSLRVISILAFLASVATTLIRLAAVWAQPSILGLLSLLALHGDADGAAA